MYSILRTFVVLATIAVLAGCRAVSAEDLRTRHRYYSTYSCPLDYEEAYKTLLQAGVNQQVIAAAMTAVGLQHAIYPASHTATIFRHYSETGIDPLVVWWVIDIAGRDAGCAITVCGISPGRWDTADNIVRTLPAIEMTSCWDAPPELLRR